MYNNFIINILNFKLFKKVVGLLINLLYEKEKEIK